MSLVKWDINTSTRELRAFKGLGEIIAKFGETIQIENVKDEENNPIQKKKKK